MEERKSSLQFQSQIYQAQYKSVQPSMTETDGTYKTNTTNGKGCTDDTQTQPESEKTNSYIVEELEINDFAGDSHKMNSEDYKEIGNAVSQLQQNQNTLVKSSSYKNPPKPMLHLENFEQNGQFKPLDQIRKFFKKINKLIPSKLYFYQRPRRRNNRIQKLRVKSVLH